MKPLDYKMIGLIIAVTLGFSGIGYAFTWAVGSLNDPEKVKSFDCSTLTEEQWHKDPSGGGFRNLDEYKQFCVKDKQVILDQPKIIGPLMIVILPIGFALLFMRIFGIYKDDLPTSGEDRL